MRSKSLTASRTASWTAPRSPELTPRLRVIYFKYRASLRSYRLAGCSTQKSVTSMREPRAKISPNCSMGQARMLCRAWRLVWMTTLHLDTMKLHIPFRYAVPQHTLHCVHPNKSNWSHCLNAAFRSPLYDPMAPWPLLIQSIATWSTYPPG